MNRLILFEGMRISSKETDYPIDDKNALIWKVTEHSNVLLIEEHVIFITGKNPNKENLLPVFGSRCRLVLEFSENEL